METNIYQRLFDSANVPILILNADFQFIDCNDVALRILNRSKNEVLGKTPIDDSLSPETQPNGRSSSEMGSEKFELARMGDDQLFSWVHLKKDRTQVSVEVSIFGFVASQKRNYFVMWNDLTAEKIKEKKLRESEERFRTIFTNATDGVILHTPDMKAGITHCNEAAYKILGYDSENGIIGKSILDISPPIQADGRKTEDSAKGHLKACLKNGMTRFEWIHLKKNGSHIWFDIVLTRITLNDKAYIHTQLRDITEAKKLQANIYRVRVESEESERERYANELHDGLGPLLASCKLFLEGLSDINDPHTRETSINKSVDLIDSAIDGIYEISNNLTPNALRNYGLEKAVKIFVNRLNSKGMSFDIESELSTRLPELFEITLYRTLIELINNSMKHSQASEIKIHIAEADHNLHLKFSENGRGFDYERTMQHGKGFGLLNLEERIKNIGGNYEYITAPDQGVHVNITIPNVV